MSERRIDDGYHVFHWSHGSPHPSTANEYKHDWLRERGVTYNREQCEVSPYVQTSVSADNHQTTWCAQKAINFIETHANRSEPWVFLVNIFDPHFPFDPPEEYLDKYLQRLDKIDLPEYVPGELEDKPSYQSTAHRGGNDGEEEQKFDRGDVEALPYPQMDDQDHRVIRAAYWAMVDLIDTQVGRLLNVLNRTAQRDKTIVIFMSDHGEMLGDHGLYLKGPFFYESAIRVPLIISYPNEILRGSQQDELVELIDVAPMLMQAADIGVPDRVQGTSLWPLLTRRSPDGTHREAVYCEYYNALTHHSDPEPFATMVRTDCHKLVRYHALDDGELYDLDADPDEHENKWGDPAYREVQHALETTLSDKMAATVDPHPPRLASW